MVRARQLIQIETMASFDSIAAKKHALEDSSNQSSSAPVPKKLKGAPAKNYYTAGDIAGKIEAAKQEQIKNLVVDFYVNHSVAHVKTLDEFLTHVDFTSSCFCCFKKEEDLEILGGEIAVCSTCENSKQTMNLGEIKETFGLSKGSAQKIHHTFGPSSWGGGFNYIFRLRDVIQAIKQNHTKKVRKHIFGTYSIRWTKDDFHHAETKEKKKQVLEGALANISEQELKAFALKSLKKVPRTEVGGFLEAL